MTSSKPVEEIEEEGIVEFSSNVDYISGCYMALNAISEIDTALLSKEEERRIKSIRNKSLRIIELCISEYYVELFDEQSED